ncbi:hypothetical protein D3Z38_19090 [Clostridiales bacterium]|nr:hypothetical protein [Clostridiales bacterium]
MNLLNLILRGLMGCLKVHEEGIWEYVKLPNGLAICHGAVTNHNVTSSKEGGAYWTGLSKDLPNGLFVETPKAWGTIVANFLGFVTVSERSTKDHLNVFEATMADVVHDGHVINLLVIGRWK